MSILNDKLETIIADSGLYFYQDEIEEEFKVTDDRLIDLDSTVKAIWGKLPDDANIGIFGLGSGSIQLFSSIDLGKKKVVCMIDNNYKTDTFNGYPVIRSKEMIQNKIDIVIITSADYADEMEADVNNISPKIKIIHLWKEIDSCGYIYNHTNLFHPGIEKKYFAKAIALYKSIQLYEANKDYRYLRYIIYGYLMFRDIKNALDYLDRYIESDHCDIDKMIGFKSNIVQLLDEIKQTLASKQNNHCLVLIADSMRARDITEDLTPFLSGLARDNIHCINAYAHIVWTTTSLLTMFKRKSYFDHHLYSNVKLSGDEFFFEQLKKDKISFTYYWYSGKSLFDGISDEVTVKSCRNWSADMIWQYLCDAFENDAKSICFLHFGETHTPNFCLGSDVLNYRCANNYFKSVKYIDSQTEFLFHVLSEDKKVIFCSDHGSIRHDKKCKTTFNYNNDRCHIPYVIYDGLTHEGENKRMVSHLDTTDIVMNLMNNRPAFENISHRDFVEINEEFYYSEPLIKMIINNPTTFKDRAGEAFKCFITEKDKYVIFHDGEEKYFMMPDDDTNLIDNPLYIDRINWFRENVNTKFPDWSDDNGRYDVTRKYFKL